MNKREACAYVLSMCLYQNFEAGRYKPGFYFEEFSYNDTVFLLHLFLETGDTCL